MISVQMENVKKQVDKFLVNIQNLVIPQGCIVGIVGENGSGKTTLLKIIAGIQKIDSGKINLLGRSSEMLEPVDLQKTGIIFQDIWFPKNMTVSQIEKYCSMCFLQWDNYEFNKVLDEFQIPKESEFSALSAGMKSKVFFAVALSHNAQLLLLDEALTGLDPIARDIALKKLSEFIENEKNTVLISSNVVSDFEKNTDYILYMSAGEIKFFESIETLRENYMVCDYDDLKCLGITDRYILGINKNDFSTDALIDISKFEKTPNISMRRASIEEIIIFVGGKENA